MPLFGWSAGVSPARSGSNDGIERDRDRAEGDDLTCACSVRALLNATPERAKEEEEEEAKG